MTYRKMTMAMGSALALVTVLGLEEALEEALPRPRRHHHRWL